jgi:hypothetical protein
MNLKILSFDLNTVMNMFIQFSCNSHYVYLLRVERTWGLSLSRRCNFKSLPSKRTHGSVPGKRLLASHHQLGCYRLVLYHQRCTNLAKKFQQSKADFEFTQSHL